MDMNLQNTIYDFMLQKLPVVFIFLNTMKRGGV